MCFQLWKIRRFRICFSNTEGCVEKEIGRNFEPKIIIADAAEAITKGFSLIFGENYVRIQCWAHVVRNLLKKMKDLKINEDKRILILDDIKFIQRAHNKSSFILSTKLFAKKWESEVIFIRYFIDNWINKNCGWSSSTYPGVPKTNNSLEAVNNTLKRFYTIPQKLVFTEFMQILLQVVSDWSNIRDPENVNFKDFHTKVKINNDLIKNALTWKRKKLKLVKKDDKFIYYAASRNELQISNICINNYEKNLHTPSWNNFEDYRIHMSVLSKITYDPSNFSMTTCSCVQYQKYYICKHYVGIGLKKNILL